VLFFVSLSCITCSLNIGVLGPHIEVYGDWIPRNVFGRFHAFFAILRMVYLAFIIVFVYSTWADLIILDGVSAPVPILKYFGGFKVLFYCHFPDLVIKIILNVLFTA